MRSAPLRRSHLALVAVLALSSLADDAHAQSASGSIVVGAVILPNAPGTTSAPLHVQLRRDGQELSIRAEPTNVGLATTIFVRVDLPSSSPADRRFVGRRIATGEEVRVRLPGSARNTGVHLERLILAGT